MPMLASSSISLEYNALNIAKCFIRSPFSDYLQNENVADLLEVGSVSWILTPAHGHKPLQNRRTRRRDLHSLTTQNFGNRLHCRNKINCECVKTCQGVLKRQSHISI